MEMNDRITTHAKLTNIAIRSGILDFKIVAIGNLDTEDTNRAPSDKNYRIKHVKTLYNPEAFG